MCFAEEVPGGMGIEVLFGLMATAVVVPEEQRNSIRDLETTCYRRGEFRERARER